MSDGAASTEKNCYFTAVAVVRDRKGIPYLLMSSCLEGDEQMQLVIYETRSAELVPPHILEALGVEVGGAGAHSFWPEEEGSNPSDQDDEIVICSVTQDVDGAMFFGVGRKADMPKDGEYEPEGHPIDLWIYTIADDIPPEVIASVDRIAAAMGAEVEPEPTYES